MSTIINFQSALLRKRDEEFGRRTVISKEFAAEVLGRETPEEREARIDRAILKAECLMNEWRRRQDVCS